jgi:hypothetical protein
MLTGGLGNVMTVDQSAYEWNVLMSADRAISIKRCVYNGAEVTDANATVGLNGQSFLLYLEDQWFGPGAVIEFDEKEYQARVVDEPYQDGDTWVYRCTVATGNPTDYIPGDLVIRGHKVSRVGSQYEEYSDESDILNYHTHFKMRNYMTTTRIKYDITGSALETVMAIALKDPETGNTSYLWADYQEWEGLRQWYQRLEYQMVYGKCTVNKDGSSKAIGKNGRPILAGAGLLEQIAPSNRRYYTKLTAELLEDFLADLSYNVLGTNERKFVALTGEMGMREFDRVIKEKISTMNLMDTVFVTGTGDNLVFGGQFKTYRMTNGIELTVKYFPLYDDLEHNRDLDPITLKPKESYRMTFIDFGRRDGESNVVKVVRKNREMIIRVIPGMVNPSRDKGSLNSFAANAKDGYTVLYLGEWSLMVRDPRACGELIRL